MSTSLVPAAPGPCTAPGTSSGVPAPDELLAALPGRIEPVRRSRAFRLRLAVAALTLLLVLTIYLALVVLTSYGVWCHVASPGLVAEVRRLFGDPGPYYAFCIAGPILCVFLVKPIFTMRRADRPAVALDRSAEPRLFAFVERLCAAQGVPVPRQIRVDTDVNAWASLRHGLISLFRDDLLLTVGLPLARTMTARQFAGILAHEFGHFAQGGARRLDYLIRRLVFFMLRIVHERDGFDEMLIESSRFRFFLDPRITLALIPFTLIMNGVRMFLWLARGLLKGLAWVGLAASAGLVREMEFDADRHGMRIAGSETFIEVGGRVALLGAASQTALALQGRWGEGGRLADDLPGLVAAMSWRLAADPGTARDILDRAMQETTGRFDTHPALRDRFAAAEREAEPGAFRLEAPASALFSDLDGLCRAATLAAYQDTFRLALSRVLIIPVADLLAELEGDRASSERLARFAQGCPIAACRVSVGPSDIAATDGAPGWEEAARSLESARQNVRDLAPAAAEAARRLDEARQRHARFNLALALIHASCPVDPDLSGMPMIDAETALDARKQAGTDVQAAGCDLAPMSRALTDRLRAALHLRCEPEIAERLRAGGNGDPGAADLARCDALVAVLAALDSVRPALDGLQSRLTLLQGLLQQAAKDASYPKVMHRAYDAGKEIRQILKGVRDALDRVPYPYPATSLGAQGGSDAPTIRAFLGPASGAIDIDTAGVYNDGIESLSKIRSLEDRILASLAAIAEEVETALGLPPLPDPPGEADQGPTGQAVQEDQAE